MNERAITVLPEGANRDDLHNRRTSEKEVLR